MSGRSPEPASKVLAKLSPHPRTPGLNGLRMSVDVTRRAGMRLHLWYFASGNSGLRLAAASPRPGSPVRRDEIWRNSCCELFIRAGHGYYELNFAPNGDWAAYHFTGYREGRTMPELVSPVVESHRRGDAWHLQARVDLSGRDGIDPQGPWALALSAVVDAKNGDVSYWSLAHPTDKPDFHHPGSFLLTLPPLEPA